MFISTDTTINGRFCSSCGGFVRSDESHVCGNTITNTPYYSYDNAELNRKLDKVLELLRENLLQTCCICGRDCEHYLQFGFESLHDGDSICDECCQKHIDPFVALLRDRK